jgi:heme exporter protein D
MNLGPYVVFIMTAYAAAIVIVAGLIVWIMLDRHHLIRMIEDIEAQGITRRSNRAREEKP